MLPGRPRSGVRSCGRRALDAPGEACRNGTALVRQSLHSCTEPTLTEADRGARWPSMTRIAYVFPGQGSQVVGMGRDLAAAQPAAAAVFREADEALREPISALAWEGPADELNRTENAQPALLAASIAYLDALGERADAAGAKLPLASFFGGHSMGQYSAAVATGAIETADAVRLVRERGRLMQSSGA